MTLEAILFDLDGTLLDSAPDFVATLDQLAEEFQLDNISEKLIRQTVSNGARALTTLLFGLTETDPAFVARRQRLLDVYAQYLGVHSDVYPGVIELLQCLERHDLRWGVITNKPERFAKPIMAQLHLPTPPQVLICPDHVVYTKPDPEPLLLACQHLHCSPKDVIYIGDHQRDIDCGKGAGCETIAAAYGYLHPDDDIHQWLADHVVDHPSDIWPIIKKRLQYENTN